MELKDRIIDLLSKTSLILDGGQILEKLEKEQPGSIPKVEGLFDVNEFFELEEEQRIRWEATGWVLVE